MFTFAERNHVRDRILQMATSDPRIAAAAAVGSLALADGDRWSDLDLTFGVKDEVPVQTVLEEWTASIEREFHAVQLFDLPHGPIIYRVFLLPGCLQFDLSFAPASKFGATGPKFKLLFGLAVDRPFDPVPKAEELFGYAVHHALRARFCIERGRLLQAEYWISAARDYALHLACLRRGLPAREGRGFDDLPGKVRQRFAAGLVGSLDPDELLRALGVVVTGLMEEAGDVRNKAEKVEPQLRLLVEKWHSG